MVKITRDKKVFSEKLKRYVIRRVTEDVPKSQLSKRTLGQLNRWKSAKKAAREISKIDAPKQIKKISPRKIFNEIRYFRTDKAKATIERRGKEARTRAKNKDAYDPSRPYFREWWIREKDLHEHSDDSGFQYRFIDRYRYSKLLQALKKQSSVRVWCLFWLDIDWTEVGKENYDGYFIDEYGDVLPYTGFAGEIDASDPDTKILLHKARKGSSKEAKILDKWQRLYDVAIFNMTEAFGSSVKEMHFQGFVVSQRDIGKTRPKY